MKSYRKELWFNTPNRLAFVNITRQVEECVRESGVKEGLVLANAIYFLGSWQHTFEKAATTDEPFYVTGGGETTVPMMRQQERFGHAETASAQILELPYKSAGTPSLSMVVVLPRERGGLRRSSRSSRARASWRTTTTWASGWPTRSARCRCRRRRSGTPA